ncbi:mitofilin family membrane protein [Stappia sp.]|uniref:mitofilin family membrane protein n=1 Tax=Stappia sp. TaxID=1870903 RepID=UPI0032D94F1F
MSDSKTSGTGAGGPTASGAKPQTAASATSDKASSSGAGIGGLLAASILGAAVALGGVYGAHRAGYLPVETGADADLQAALTAAQSRVAGLEERVAGLSEAQERAAGDDGAVETLRGQISALEERVAALAAAPDAGDLPEDVAGRLDAVESGLGELRRFVSSGGAGETAGLASLEQSLAGLSDQARDNAESVSALGERVDALSAELEADPGTDALAARVGELETALAGAQDTASGLAGLRETVDAVAQTVAAQGETAGQQATTLEAVRTDLGALEERLGARLSDLSAQVSALDERLTPVEARIGDATARETAARALAVSRLKAALDRGAPFETELAAVAAALPQDADLGVLSERAGDGVPTQATLKARFGAVARSMSAALDRPADGDVVDSFWSNARSLVSIRQPGDTDADTPAAALGRMEARVEAGDFAGAVEAYETLPEAVRAAGADWVADARARVAADRLVDLVTADVLKSLGSASN